mgnify:CR=1 FL=1
MSDPAPAADTALPDPKGKLTFKSAAKFVNAGKTIEAQQYKTGSLAARIAEIKAGLKHTSSTDASASASGAGTGAAATTVPVAPVQTETALREEVSVLSDRVIQLEAEVVSGERRLAESGKAREHLEQRRVIGETVSKAKIAQLEERLDQSEQREQRGLVRVTALEDEVALLRLLEESSTASLRQS